MRWKQGVQKGIKQFRNRHTQGGMHWNKMQKCGRWGGENHRLSLCGVKTEREQWGESTWGKKKTNVVKQSHGRDYKFARNHSFQLTQEKGNTVGSHNETAGPSLKSRGRKTKPNPTWLSAVVAPQRNAPCWTFFSSVSTFINNSPSTLGQESRRA